MSRPLDHPEAIAAAILAQATTNVEANHRTLPWNEADEELIDRAVATIDPVTGERWVPARRWGR